MPSFLKSNSQEVDFSEQEPNDERSACEELPKCVVSPKVELVDVREEAKEHEYAPVDPTTIPSVVKWMKEFKKSLNNLDSVIPTMKH